MSNAITPEELVLDELGHRAWRRGVEDMAEAVRKAHCSRCAGGEDIIIRKADGAPCHVCNHPECLDRMHACSAYDIWVLAKSLVVTGAR